MNQTQAQLAAIDKSIAALTIVGREDLAHEIGVLNIKRYELVQRVWDEEAGLRSVPVDRDELRERLTQQLIEAADIRTTGDGSAA